MAADLVSVAEAPVDDPFAETRAAYPGYKLIRYIHLSLGVEFIAKFAPGSAYFDLLGNATEQTLVIQPRDPLQLK